MVAACSMSEEEVAENPKPQVENVDQASEEKLPEGSFSDRFQQKNADGEDYETGSDGHPTAQEVKQFKREIFVPDNVKGKWKAVKILVGDKSDEEKNEVKIVDLGSSFMLGDSGIKVSPTGCLRPKADIVTAIFGLAYPRRELQSSSLARE